MVKQLWNGSGTQRATLAVLVLGALGLVAAAVTFGMIERDASSRIEDARTERASILEERERMRATRNGERYAEYKAMEVDVTKRSDALRKRARERTDLIASGRRLDARANELDAQIGALVSVPDVTGLHASEAADVLEARGLEPIWGTELAAVTFSGSCAAFEDADPSEVLKTAPGTGARVPYGTTVYLGTYYPSGDSWQRMSEKCDDTSSSDDLDY